MPIYSEIDKEDKLVRVLRKLRRNTPITAINAGSVARAFAEILVDELDKFDRILEFSTANSLISKAQGRALDALGQLYGVERKRLSNIAETNRIVGQFYFYLDQQTPHNEDITIPAGVKVSTAQTEPSESLYTYRTTRTVVLETGRYRVYVPLEPDDTGSTFTAGAETLTRFDFEPPEGVNLKSTNPKPIDAVVGYESDDAYRDRIIQGVRSAGGGTLQALRLRGLQRNGVREIRMRNAPYGLGTIEAVVVPEDTSASRVVLADVTSEMNRIRPAGSRLVTTLPEYVSVGAVIKLIIGKGYENVPKNAIETRAKNALTTYLNSLLPGDRMIYARLIDVLLNSSEAVEDVLLTSLRIGNTEVLRQNYKPRQNQQVIPSTGDISVKAIPHN